MMNHIVKYDTMILQRQSYLDDQTLQGADTLMQDFEALLYGLMKGMSGKSESVCNVGLENMIFEAFEMWSYSDFYNPTHWMKFNLALHSMV
jgi:hypothetical protein